MNTTLPATTGNGSSGLRVAAAQPAEAATLIRELFDRTFYLAAYADVAAAGIDALDHFLQHGLHEGRSPHPLFDPGFYAAQMPPAALGEPPLLHYLRCGAADGLDPHPLFDTAHYVAQTDRESLFGQLPLLHFLRAGTLAQLSPNPLFDAGFYRRANGLGDSFPRHPLLHYVEAGWREGCRTHPLFDPTYYLALRPDVARAGIEPLAHYLHHGFHETQSTHELFDTSFYQAAFSEQPVERAAIMQRGAIIHYARIAAGHNARNAAGPATLPSPHPLFDRAFYAARHLQAGRTGVDAFLHFLEVGLGKHHDPHPLFESAFYARRNPDVAAAGLPPFLHFVRHGAQELRDPNSCFDPARYLDRHPEAATLRFGALSHYLLGGTTAPVSDRFDACYYSHCLAAAGQPHGQDPLSHYLASGREAGLGGAPRPLAQLGWHGGGERREPPTATPVLLISPDAGAQPLSRHALRAAQNLSADSQIACRVALLQGGPLESEFVAAAPTLLLAGAVAAAELLHAFARDAPDGVVIINSLLMPQVLRLSSELGLRRLVWLHEMPVVIDSMPEGPGSMQSLAGCGTRIVTASNHARNALRGRYGLHAEQIVVLGNGIEVHSGSGSEARALAIAAREQLGMPPDALLVLGGGAPEFVRGCDLFIKVAEQVVRQGAQRHAPENALAQAHFVWAGEETDRLFSGLCRQDVEQLGLSSRFRFVSGTAAMQTLLLAADVFLMTARAEAFDADGMQASRNGVPVIAFQGCADAADLPEERGSCVVGSLDTEAMARAVLKLGDRPARRRVPPRPLSAAPVASWSLWYDGLRRILERDFGVAGG